MRECMCVRVRVSVCACVCVRWIAGGSPKASPYCACRHRPMSAASRDPEGVHFPDPSKGGVSVAVVVRAKPPSPADSPLVVSMTKTSTTIVMPGARKHKTLEKTFNFDRCYWSVAKSDPDYASQDTVFSEVRPFLNGMRLCVC